MNSKWTKRTIHDIALRNNLHDSTIEMIVMSQFETVRNEMRNADPENGYMPRIHMIKLATFIVKKGRLSYLRGKQQYRDRIARQRERKYNNLQQQECLSTKTEKSL